MLLLCCGSNPFLVSLIGVLCGSGSLVSIQCSTGVVLLLCYSHLRSSSLFLIVMVLVLLCYSCASLSSLLCGFFVKLILWGVVLWVYLTQTLHPRRLGVEVFSWVDSRWWVFSAASWSSGLCHLHSSWFTIAHMSCGALFTLTSGLLISS